MSARDLHSQVLLLSMRGISDLVAFSILYEFEDVIAGLTGAKRVDASHPEVLERCRRCYKYLRMLTGSRQLAARLGPSPAAVELDRDYELFLPIFNHPYELFALRGIANWRSRCRVTACIVNEVWAHEMPEYLLELLQDFDHLFVCTQNGSEAVSRLLGRPVHYLPIAADVLRFAPVPGPSARGIDVCNIGRRSVTTHGALIELARARRINYYYDTFAAGIGKYANQRTFSVENAAEHRLLLAMLLRQSRYYIANRSRVNQPEFTAGREELSGRFFEGAAAGCVMIGEAPRLQKFREFFDWEDAVIPMPFDKADVGDFLAALDADPWRLARIRSTNVSQAAMRHDWMYRFQDILDLAGLPRTLAMQERAQQLQQLASRVAQGGAS